MRADVHVHYCVFANRGASQDECMHGCVSKQASAPRDECVYVYVCALHSQLCSSWCPAPFTLQAPPPTPPGLAFTKGLPSASCGGAQSEPDRCRSCCPSFAPRPVPFPCWGSPSSPPTPYPPCSPAPYASPPPPPLQERGAAGGGGGIGRGSLVFLAPSFPPSRVAMYDCMETFAPGPRRLYGAVGPGAGLLRRATGSSCFAGLESFAWPQPASLQCRYTSPGLGCGVQERQWLTLSMCKTWNWGASRDSDFLCEGRVCRKERY